MGQTDQKGTGSFFSINRATFTWPYIVLLNIIQPAWDIKWVIAGDEAHNEEILLVKMFAEHLNNLGHEK